MCMQKFLQSIFPIIPQKTSEVSILYSLLSVYEIDTFGTFNVSKAVYNSWFKVDNMPMDFLSVGEVQLEMAAQTCMIDRPGADPKIFKGGGEETV